MYRKSRPVQEPKPFPEQHEAVKSKQLAPIFQKKTNKKGLTLQQENQKK